MAILPGRLLGPYEILSAISAGGMGEVYKAEDLKLHRHVALRFLPQEMENGPAARERVQREAFAASAPNHPNICTIHEIEEGNGQHFIAMEFLELQEKRMMRVESRRSLSMHEAEVQIGNSAWGDIVQARSAVKKKTGGGWAALALC